MGEKSDWKHTSHDNFKIRSFCIIVSNSTKFSSREMQFAVISICLILRAFCFVHHCTTKQYRRLVNAMWYFVELWSISSARFARSSWFTYRSRWAYHFSRRNLMRVHFNLWSASNGRCSLFFFFCRYLLFVLSLFSIFSIVYIILCLQLVVYISNVILLENSQSFLNI